MIGLSLLREAAVDVQQTISNIYIMVAVVDQKGSCGCAKSGVLNSRRARFQLCSLYSL